MASSPTDREAIRKQHRALVLELTQAALAAVEPSSAVRSHFRMSGDVLQVDGRQYDLTRYQKIYVVGGGKATAPMAQEVERVLGNRISAGIVTVKYGYQLPTERIQVEQAGHPIPDERAVKATDRMLGLVERAARMTWSSACCPAAARPSWSPRVIRSHWVINAD